MDKEVHIMICSKCGNEYKERPARSRIDNSDICPLCGQIEALEDAVTSGAMSREVAKGIWESLQNKD